MNASLRLSLVIVERFSPHFCERRNSVPVRNGRKGSEQLNLTVSLPHLIRSFLKKIGTMLIISYEQKQFLTFEESDENVIEVSETSFLRHAERVVLEKKRNDSLILYY